MMMWLWVFSNWQIWVVPCTSQNGYAYGYCLIFEDLVINFCISLSGFTFHLLLWIFWIFKGIDTIISKLKRYLFNLSKIYQSQCRKHCLNTCHIDNYHCNDWNISFWWSVSRDTLVFYSNRGTLPFPGYPTLHGVPYPWVFTRGERGLKNKNLIFCVTSLFLWY